MFFFFLSLIRLQNVNSNNKQCHYFVFTSWMTFINCLLSISFKSDKLDYLLRLSLSRGFNILVFYFYFLKHARIYVNFEDILDRLMALTHNRFAPASLLIQKHVGIVRHSSIKGNEIFVLADRQIWLGQWWFVIGAFKCSLSKKNFSPRLYPNSTPWGGVWFIAWAQYAVSTNRFCH